ncbi:hypothetical protein EJ04DRAFT_568674 [Polyplosphaeria fusca]|uniref:Autophagy-related protein 2 n=1 Tax=Polyplosphaeria fusca TaxID=682080 RepID=A0A9P4UXV6_9PLEO|nr:hypothetical protein EJ04DRAFT_568674 [Polyplosphaeria fusca]
MAFFAAVSSSIGKKLLLYGLRQIDILDKDPADFVSVDVGKKTTLEVRDVGLHVKKLVSLLHLKLPPELHLSRARASLFRVTFVFDFGVPQILIQVDGVQVHARLAAETDVPSSPSSTKDAKTSPRRPPGSPPPPVRLDSEDSDSDDGPEHDYMPTVAGLTKSFIREEPVEEIRELEEALHTQSENLADSIASSQDGDEDIAEGLGVSLGLPAVLRNLLNTALDRMQIVATHIDVQVDEQLSTEPSNTSTDPEDPSVSLNFHIERISVDSVTSADANVDIGPAHLRSNDSASKLGKRRLQLSRIYARLISDADNFSSIAAISRSSSPLDTRSEASSVRPSQSEDSEHRSPVDKMPSDHESSISSDDKQPSLHSSTSSRPGEHSVRSLTSHPSPDRLKSSILTVDEDRFADAASDDGADRSFMQGSVAPSHQSLPHDMSASSVSYDDESLLDYVIENDLVNSAVRELPEERVFSDYAHRQSGDRAAPSRETMLPSKPLQDSSNLPSVSQLGSFSRPLLDTQTIPHPHASEHSSQAAESLPGVDHQIPREQQSVREQSPPSDSEDLLESKLFSHEDAESMYMSAMSAAPATSSHNPAVPGGWESSSSSSQGTGSDTTTSVPPEMVAGSILETMHDADDGCETPRPGSRQSSPIGVRGAHARARTDLTERKISKQFLSIDQVTVWFPLELEDSNQRQTASDPTLNTESTFKFAPSNLGEDSIFQDMPGAFSTYAHSSSSSSSRRMTTSTSGTQRPSSRPPMASKPQGAEKDHAANISISIGTVIAHLDFSTGAVMYRMLDRVTKGFVESPPQEMKAQTPPDAVATAPMTLELSIKNVCLAWLERLATESVGDIRASPSALELNPFDVIVKLDVASIHVGTQITAQETRTKLRIAKFVLSSLGQDIVSFHSPQSKSRRSMGSLPAQLSNDIEIDLEQAKDRRLTVVTRPVKVTFDLQQLDEALSSFGGFSGVLELGNSFSSNFATNQAVSPTRPKPRAVHFGDTPSTAPSKTSSMPKIQVQFGEVMFVLKGKSCALQLQTTAVRCAIRENNLRMKVSEIQVSGPFTSPDQVGTPLLMDIKGTTISLLFAPEEVDLTKLISMITPSKDPYENDEDILIDTLLRQRRKGSVLRVEIGSMGLQLSDLTQMQTFEALATEVARLSKVTKYLPDDDRPGILTLAALQHFEARVVVNDQIGDVSITCQDASIAHVGVPALFAIEIGLVSLNREEELLVHNVVQLRPQDQLPMLMARVIGDELEPMVKAKLFNICIEYRVSTVMAALGISDDGTVDDIALGLASSVATITGASPKMPSKQTSQSSSPSTTKAKPLQIDLLARSCAIGLNPRKLPSKGLFVLTEAHFTGKQTKTAGYSMTVELRKASVHAIDDVNRIEARSDTPSVPATNTSFGYTQLLELRDCGFVSLSSISAAQIFVNILGDGKDQPQIVDVEFKNELFVLESCADSTQTLIAILNGLQPPTPPSTAQQYRTVVPLQQMMESFTGDAITAVEEDDNFMDNADLVADEVPNNLEFVGSFYNPESLPNQEDLGDSMLGEDDLGVLTPEPTIRKRGDRGLLESFQEQYEVAEGEPDFDFDQSYFRDSDSEHKGTARKWDSEKNKYELTNEFKTPDAPLKVRMRDVNIVWNLFDGYDWPRTRGIIAQAVEDVEARAEERRRRPREEDDEEDFVEADFLFNSVWVGIPVKEEKGALARAINRDIDDLASETGSYATSTATRSTGATVRPRSATKSHRRKLKLERSKHRKISFQLSGLAVDLIVFPPDTGETQNSVNVRIRDFEIIDHVPSSTWRKFATSFVDPSQRELNRPMINLELLTVKPVTDLAASELVIRVTVQPLRLHVDQDALDFITRFFEFKDDSIPEPSAHSEQPFIQRLEVMAVTLKLDYKPKRVDYRGLRSGHTTEFMNFLILDGSDIILRHAIVYGITSFDKLNKTLNDVWMPDVKRNQLPGVLAGLAAVRPIVNVGSGVRDLIVVPMREYKKDGRIVRSLQKGVYAFAKNTTSEVARLGAKMAIGTQNLLEGAEQFLNTQPGSPRSPYTLNDWDEVDASPADEEPRAHSNYANQPIGVKAGLRNAARYLERDLLTARDAIIAIPGEVMEEGTGAGMAKAIARRAPTVILRPALGTTKAISNALLGVGNALDKDSKRKIEDKYKGY